MSVDREVKRVCFSLQMLCDINELLQGDADSEIDDILRQETRHEDEWMKQFLEGLL